jgi:nucleoside-triphosphatase
MSVRVLVEGRPGSGKTTVIERVATLLAEQAIDVRGFVTRELREHGRRVGFQVKSLDGEQATLAHTKLSGPPRVGKYGVDLDSFEEIALPTLARPPRDAVVVIDELGKMELASERFREAVMRLLEAPVDLVATVHVYRHPLTDRLKRRRDIERVKLTRGERDALPEQLAERLLAGRRQSPSKRSVP